MSNQKLTTSASLSARDRTYLFWASFTAIAATAAVFAVRGQVIGDWASEFGLTETQKGEILGVGLWPFAGSIVLVSMVADRIGYGRCFAFAFLCHVLSTFLLLFAQGYWWLYAGTFLVSIGNGAAQAITDPMVASMYRNKKTTMLNILHAGWPAGMVVGGIAAISLSGADLEWRWRVGMLLIPFALYGLMLFRRHFPVHERVEAGVTDRAMFSETGGVGMFLLLVFLFIEIARIAELHWAVAVAAALACAAAFGFYTRSAGRPMYVVLLLIMLPLATTELGTDSWITSLMEGPMREMGAHAGWVLVYTSFIMMILRFCARPVVELLTPLGLLAASCVLAIGGLIMLSKAQGMMILGAATVFGIGKTYLWPTMLGIVAERFPKGGALSLNGINAVGMMSVGIMGTVFLGQIQDRAVESRLAGERPALHGQLVIEKRSVFGKYQAVDPERVEKLSAEERGFLGELGAAASRNALATTAVFPFVMLGGYIGLWCVFRRRGGYRAVELKAGSPENGE